MSKFRRMFPGGNTSKGFVSFHDNIIGTNRNKLYILKGMPGGGKSSLMKEIGRRASEEGFTLEYHHCPSDPNSIDAIVIKELKIGLIDGTPPHPVDPLYPGLTEDIVDLTRYINKEEIKAYKDKLIKAREDNKKAYGKAFNYFKAAKCVYDEIENTNKTNVDFKKVNDLSKKYIDEIFKKTVSLNYNHEFEVRYLFSSAYTPEGYYDYIETILDGMENIYYLQGEIGTGKSTFLNRIVEESRIRNFHVEIYYDSILVDKIESVLIHELNTIISSNDLAKKYSHTLIDFNQYFNNFKINEDDYSIYDFLIKKGIEGLKDAKKNHFILESSYKEFVDYEGIDEERERIWGEIQRFIYRV